MPEYRFPEAFLEIGKDEDHSYRSLRTTRLSDGRLKIDVEGWGIKEVGLYFDFRTGEILEIHIRGHCGTVSGRTWEKVSFSRVVEKDEENKAKSIEYPSYVWVKTGQITLQFRLYKEPYEAS